MAHLIEFVVDSNNKGYQAVLDFILQHTWGKSERGYYTRLDADMGTVTGFIASTAEGLAAAQKNLEKNTEIALPEVGQVGLVYVDDKPMFTIHDGFVLTNE